MLRRQEQAIEDLRRQIRLLEERVRVYERHGLQSARFKNLTELFAASDHTH